MTDSPANGYSLIGKIGEGGYGEVWRARNNTTGHVVALKFPTKASSANDVKRFKREVRLQGQLGHPNILPLLDFDVESERPWHATPLMEANLTETAASLPRADAIKCFQDVLQAAIYAHKNRVVHRDINPNNVLLERNSGNVIRAVLADFGLGRSLATGAESWVTNMAVGGGTPSFVAPEQWESLHSADERSDIYSLGRLLEFIVGVVAEAAPDKNRLAYCIATSTALAPEARYQNVAQLASDFDVVMSRPGSFRRPIDAAMDLIATLTSANASDASQLRQLAALLVEHRQQEKLVLGLMPMLTPTIIRGLVQEERAALTEILTEYSRILQKPLTLDTALAAMRVLEDIHEAAQKNSVLRILCLRTIISVAADHDIAEMAYIVHRTLVSEEDAGVLLDLARFIRSNPQIQEWCAINLGQSMIAPVLLDSFDVK